jgi:hypothetical protein
VDTEDEGQNCIDKCRAGQGNADDGVCLGNVWRLGVCLDYLGVLVDLHCLFG